MENNIKNSLEVGTVLNDKWVILEFIDKGGMGEVYRAHQINLKRDVAIKVISREWLESCIDNPEELETGLQRFRNEVQAMAQIRHPNVLQIFDYGSVTIKKDDEDMALEYIAMEYIPGGTLISTMSKEGFDSEEKLIRDWLSSYFLPVLDGVEAIHELKMAHRDLKPGNVLMDGSTPKIADFGLAHSHQWRPVTQSVDVKGTPAYMSPEHFIEFGKADQRSDIYSLGKILFESINGFITQKMVPFQQVCLTDPDTPFLEKLDRIIQKATAENKEERLDSVNTLRTALLDAIDSSGSEAAAKDGIPPKEISFFQQPRLIWTGIIVAIVSMVAMTLWHVLGEPLKKIDFSENQQVQRIESPKPVSPAQSIMGKDGNSMLFFPGGELKKSTEGTDGRGSTVHVKPFYLDEKRVSFHHYAEFLNEVKERLTVENGIVKKENEIWLYLGEGLEPHEQIIYAHDRFHLRDTAYAPYPVVRLTWHGALAYAQQYGKRLVTEHEWDFAVSNNTVRAKILSTNKTSTPVSSNGEEIDKIETQPHMMRMNGQNLGKETDVEPRSRQTESDDSRGSIPEEIVSDNKSTREDYKEWLTRIDMKRGDRYESGTGEGSSYSSLVTGKGYRTGVEAKTFRYPWEAFTDVGFRCALDIEDAD